MKNLNKSKIYCFQKRRWQVGLEIIAAMKSYGRNSADIGLCGGYSLITLLTSLIILEKVLEQIR